MPLKEEMGREKAKRKSGAPGEIRTPDLLLRRQSLYPSELRAHCIQFTCGLGRLQREPRENSAGQEGTPKRTRFRHAAADGSIRNQILFSDCPKGRNSKKTISNGRAGHHRRRVP